MKTNQRKKSLAVIVGNRGFFDDKVVGEGRRQVLEFLKTSKIPFVALDDQATHMAAVESWKDAQACADLFRRHRDEIAGVLVTLPNFGDEKGIADAMRLSGLQVPILVHGFPDDPAVFSALAGRRDAFCGKFSACDVLRQYGFKYSLTRRHVLAVNTDEFRREITQFYATCQVVAGMKSARLGAIGARPDSFKTVRYSEKLLEASGISVSTLDMSEVFDPARKLSDTDPRVKARMEDLKGYIPCQCAPETSLLLMAKLAVIVTDWMDANSIDATAIQCWSSIQKNYGINACTIMSMMSERLMPSGCEVDISGVASMYALQLASGRPAALVDWNNNYADDENKCVLYHCGNWAKSLLDRPEMVSAEILGDAFGAASTWGAVDGRTPAGPMTYARLDTDDTEGRIKAYVGEGRFTDDPLTAMSGTKAVVEVPRSQDLFHHICRRGFAHHSAITTGLVSGALAEAFGNYLDWELYHHK
jgi:L-fucose isomerase-like protein